MDIILEKSDEVLTLYSVIVDQLL